MAKPKKTIRDKLVRQYTALSALVILLYSIFCFFVVQKTYRESNEATFERQSQLFANDLSSNFASYGRYASILAQNASLINLISIPNPMLEKVQTLNEIVEPNIYFFLINYPGVQDIVIYSNFETTEIPSAFFRDIATVKDSHWYEAALAHPHIYWYAEDGRLYANSKVYNFMGDQILGIVQFELDLSELLEGVHAIDFATQVVITHSATGDILYSYGQQTDVSNSQWTQSIFLEVPALEIQYSVSYVPVSWKFLELVLPALVITVLACTVSVLLIRLFSTSVSRRIHTVTDAIKYIAAKNFDIAIPVAPENQQDELDELAACLNDMSQEISRLIAEIEDGKEREKEAELKTMQAKINPHFLYNILDSIGWYALKSNNRDIQALTSLLAVYYRTNLNNGQLLTTVENELMNIKAYVKLQLYMSNDGFDVEYQVDQDIKQLPVCNFIMQPLVENAILHGVKGLDDRRGKIIISAQRNGDCIDLSVSDNGYGIPEERISTILSYQGHSYGIKNVQQRIDLYYGEQYGIKISSELDAGTVATIHLPIETKDTEMYSPLA